MFLVQKAITANAKLYTNILTTIARFEQKFTPTITFEKTIIFRYSLSIRLSEKSDLYI